ncbi:hypothetical protein [Paractinoplanes durhamensis]
MGDCAPVEHTGQFLHPGGITTSVAPVAKAPKISGTDMSKLGELS